MEDISVKPGEAIFSTQKNSFWNWEILRKMKLKIYNCYFASIAVQSAEILLLIKSDRTRIQAREINVIFS